MNNKEIEVLKTIDAKNREARSYKDPTCYNAAYCFGYVDGATGALLTLSETQSAQERATLCSTITPMRTLANSIPLASAEHI